MRWLTPLLASTLCLTACSDHPRAPIEDRNAAVTQQRTAPPEPLTRASSKPATLPGYGDPIAPGTRYTVRKGDTLYAIAFRLGMDYRELARLNYISAPYRILPGQELRTAATQKAAAGKTSSANSAAAGGSSKPVASTPQAATSKPSTKTSAPVTPTPQGKPKPAVVATSPPSSKATTSKQSTSRATEPKLGPVSRWGWPSSGKVARKYSSNLHKGVDIQGSRGDPVKASASGVVVYSGTGVKGYGALLIIKHNDQYLSAYGHNDAILVEEGDAIKAGQQIAQMGSSGTDSVKLHFEIRRQGKPVDPLTLLPKR